MIIEEHRNDDPRKREMVGTVEILPDAAVSTTDAQILAV
jgi:hypothetical protein